MFENIRFDGTFRTYQQKILDGAEKYLEDGKINVVAAPGSGKTVLGLELIRRLGKPCLILSPTTTIREQWGERFTRGFVCVGDTGAADIGATDTGAEGLAALVSTDLKAPKPITSVTYQALYSAAARVKCTSDGEEVDNSSVDIYRVIEEYGIGTLCLDEAHHLQNEWQKALEEFIKKIGGRCTVISLTATPPYDASPAEWKRYISVCGEIDEEIFVPELVKSGTLCPHQDYIYFSYPDGDELRALESFNSDVKSAVDEVKACAALKSVCANLTYTYADLNGWIDDGFSQLQCVVLLLRECGLAADKRLEKELNINKYLFCDLMKIQTALNFIIAEEKLIFEREREEIVEIFKKRGLWERGKITLEKSDKLTRALAASAGKLKSIAEIAACERRNSGDKLRLLVLTDFIRREELGGVGTDKKFDGISIVSVFETLRRSCDMPIGALSGGLVLLPAACADSLKAAGARFTVKPLAGGEYCEYVFSGGNREKVSFVGALFEKGEINALVGTKSLLGEGWDSPCVNSLVLASFVGSFMLSNQMRGRAIRVDRSNPDKTANIWHLVTAEPQSAEAGGADKGGEEIFKSSDFETLARRFDCFVAPSYSGGGIRSGIARIDNIKPPYGKEGLERINADMRRRSADKASLKEAWEGELHGGGEMRRVAEVPEDRKFPAFTVYDIGMSVMLCLLLLAGAVLLVLGAVAALRLFSFIDDEELSKTLIINGAIVIFICWTLLCVMFDTRIFKHVKASGSVTHISESVLQTFKDIKMLSDKCEVKTEEDGHGYINVELLNASQREQKLFVKALGELYGMIDSQRYVILPRKKFGYNFHGALACPEAFGSRREYAEAFAKNLKKSVGRVDVIYTHGEKGRALLRKCRRNAYIYANSQDLGEEYRDY